MTEKTKETLERTERALCMHLDVLDGEIERAGGDVKDHMVIDGVKDAFSSVPDCQIRLFGKPEIHGGRRLGVVLTRGSTVEDAVKKAKLAASKIKVIY